MGGKVVSLTKVSSESVERQEMLGDENINQNVHIYL